MISASLNRCKGMEDQVGDFLKQLAAKLELVLLISFSFEKLLSQVATLTAIVRKIRSNVTIFRTEFPRLYFWINCRSSAEPSYPNVNCTSATSYNCDATVTFFLIAQQWTASDATTHQYFFFGYQPPVQLTGLLGIWMQHGDLKIFIMMHQHIEARNHLPEKKRGTITEPLKVT